MKKLYKMTVRKLIFLLFFFALLFFTVDYLNITQQLLKKEATVKSKLLIVEGWINSDYYDFIDSVFSKGNFDMLLVSGTEIDKSLVLYENGTITIRNLPVHNSSPAQKKIKLTLNGSYAPHGYPICRILLNDSLLLVEKEIINQQTISLDCSVSKTDSISILFINDAAEGKLDRNLTLEEFMIDSTAMNLHSDNLRLKTNKACVSANYSSNAEKTVFYLLNNGIPKEKMAFVYVNSYSCMSKTYCSALKATSWMRQNHYNSATIISTGFHSRRTYISYCKAAPDLSFGIVPINSYTEKTRTLKEIFGIIIISITPKFFLG